MNEWARCTLDLVHNEDYLDMLQGIYAHEDGARTVPKKSISAIRTSFENKDETTLISQLLDLGKFPYKDSYVAFLRKDRTAIERNPATVRRICDRIFDMNRICEVVRKQGSKTSRESKPLHEVISFHMARNTYITRMLASGVAPVHVQHNVGHKKLETTMLYFRDEEITRWKKTLEIQDK